MVDVTPSKKHCLDTSLSSDPQVSPGAGQVSVVIKHRMSAPKSHLNEKGNDAIPL